MALTREDVLSLIRMLSEDGELRNALRQVLFAEPLIIEVRLPADWMTKVDARLDKLDQDVGTLKQDVGTLKQDVGVMKQDVGALKQDVGTLKQDVGTLKQDVGTLKQDVGTLKQDVGTLKQDVGTLKQDVGTLQQDVGTLKQDVGTLKQDVGTLKGKVLEVDYRTKAASIFGLFLRNGRDASEFVSSRLDEAVDKGIIAPQEADFVMAADLIWMGNVRRGKFEGETVVFVGEVSWMIEPDDLNRAEEKAQVLRKAGVWAVPFVSGSVWSSPELKSRALERKILCATDSRLEPSRADWEAFEEMLAFWKP